MRIIGHLLVWVFLAVGTLAAATAYQVRLQGMSDEDLQALVKAGLTLNADAGVIVEPDSDGVEQVGPLFRRGTQVSLVQLKQLRENEATFLGRKISGSTLWVREFHFWLWPGKWMFLLSVAGMVTGAILLRRAALRRGETTERTDADDSPRALLTAAAAELQAIRAKIKKEPSEERRLALLVERLGKLQAKQLETFAENRQRLAFELGGGGMAEVMAQFSVAERQVNRAWSAACDQHEEEALACLDNAIELIQRPLGLLRGTG